MIDRRRIQEFSQAVAREFRPEKIILFGSYAYGTPSEDSDVDLLVIMPFKGRGVKKAQQILNRIQANFPLDLLVRTPETIAQRVARNDFFLKEVLARGKTLYDAAYS